LLFHQINANSNLAKYIFDVFFKEEGTTLEHGNIQREMPKMNICEIIITKIFKIKLE